MMENDNNNFPIIQQRVIDNNCESPRKKSKVSVMAQSIK